MRVGYEMLIADEARSAELAIIILYQPSASVIIVLLKKSAKHCEFFPTLFVKTTNSAFLKFWADAPYSYHIWRAWYNGSYTRQCTIVHYAFASLLKCSTIMLHFSHWNARSPQKSHWNAQIMLIIQTVFLINFKVYTYKNVQVLHVTTTTCTSS